MNLPKNYTATYNGVEYTRTMKEWSHLLSKSETYVRRLEKQGREQGEINTMQYAINEYHRKLNGGKRKYPEGRKSVRMSPSKSIRDNNEADFADRNKGFIDNFLYPRKTQIVEKREHITCQAQ